MEPRCRQPSLQGSHENGTATKRKTHSRYRPLPVFLLDQQLDCGNKRGSKWGNLRVDLVTQSCSGVGDRQPVTVSVL